VICVFNDWVALENCLKSFALQKSPPSFEVVVVDDGSQLSLPDSLNRLDLPYPIRFIRQDHAGTSAARNTGTRGSIGSVVLFTDADCILDGDCLHNLSIELAEHQNANCFQLHLVGDCSHVIGKAEQLHLATIQNYKLEPSGQIRYLNTSGAAIRRSKPVSYGPVFEIRALRAQDTLLLSTLIGMGELPRFVSSASVLHDVRLPIPKYLWKGFWTGYVEGWAYEIIKSNGVRVRSTGSERLQMLFSMWRQSRLLSWGVFPFLIVVIHQVLSFLGSLIYGCIKGSQSV